MHKLIVESANIGPPHQTRKAPSQKLALTRGRQRIKLKNQLLAATAQGIKQGIKNTRYDGCMRPPSRMKTHA